MIPIGIRDYGNDHIGRFLYQAASGKRCAECHCLGLEFVVPGYFICDVCPADTSAKPDKRVRGKELIEAVDLMERLLRGG